MDGPEFVLVNYGTTHRVRPAVILERRPGRPAGRTIRAAEWNDSTRQFNAPTWIEEARVVVLSLPDDAVMKRAKAQYDLIEAIQEIDNEMS